MELMNCSKCKKLFNYITGEKLCPACKEIMEEKFQEVKKYIEEHPHENINRVSEECGVSIRQIKLWVREERLSFTDDSLVGLECERCGRMIHSGRFCKECAGGLADAMNNAYRREHKNTIRKTASGKMRFLD